MPNSLFRLIEKCNFSPLESLQSVFVSANRSNPHLLLLKDECLKIIALDTGLEISTWRFPESYARQVQISTDFVFLGILRSPKELEIRTLYQPNHIFKISKDMAKSDSILGFEWVYQSELMVMSNAGIEFYHVDADHVFTRQKLIKQRMNWYRYWPETKLLILSSGTANLFIYRIFPKASTEAFPTLSIAFSKNPRENLNFQLTRKHVQLFSLYGHSYVGVLNTWIARPTLSLYRISKKTSYRKDFELQLQQNGDYNFNTADNILIAHNMTVGKSLIFDVKAPVPMQSLIEPCAEVFDMLDGTHEQVSKEMDWFTYSPNGIISPLTGKSFTLIPNLLPIFEHLQKRIDYSALNLTEFLIRRTAIDGLGLRTKPLLNAIKACVDTRQLRPIFDVLCANFELKKLPMKKQASAESLESGFSSHFSAVPIRVPTKSELLESEDDIFCRVFTPIATSVSPDYLIAVLLEFLDSQKSLKIAINPVIYDLLVHIIFEARAFVQLFQLIKFNVIPDSVTLANLLIDRQTPEYLQFGIDMLKRLECHQDVINILCTSNQVLEAVLYAKQVGMLKSLSPVLFLDSALAIGDKTLYINIYRYFEEQDLIPVTSPSPERKVNLSRYSSLFREFVGPILDMELV